MRSLVVAFSCLLFSCAAQVSAPDLPTGPAEILVRTHDYERDVVSFQAMHSWEELAAWSVSWTGHIVGIQAIELDTRAEAGAPWVKPVAGGLAPVDGCLRVVRP